MKWATRLILKEDGYGTIEYLALAGFVIGLTGIILANLAPEIQNLYEAMKTGVRSLANSGY